MNNPRPAPRPSPPLFRDQHLPAALAATLLVVSGVALDQYTSFKVFRGGWEVGALVLLLFYVILLAHYVQRVWLFYNGTNVLGELVSSNEDGFAFRYKYLGRTYKKVVELTADAVQRAKVEGRVVLRIHPEHPKCVQHLRQFDTAEIEAALVAKEQARA
jgi:hypothetical protein